MFRIVSVNARGLSNETKRKTVWELHRKNSDILIIRETHSTPEIENIWQSQWGGRVIYSHSTNKARGIAVFSTKEVYPLITNIIKDAEGRYIVFDLCWDNYYVTVAAIYAPNHDDPKFFKHIDTLMKDRKEHKIIIGDFNLTIDVDMDRLNTYCKQ